MKSGTALTAGASTTRIRGVSPGSASPLLGGQIYSGGVQLDVQPDKDINTKNIIKYDQYMTYITTPTLLLRTLKISNTFQKISSKN